MDKAFGWLGEIFQTLLKVIPWLVIVPATHRGVAFVRGFKVKEWPPGLHWYWPVVTNYKLMVVVRQTVRIQTKIIMTKDLKTVMVGALITYHINDVIAAGVHIADLSSDVIERAQAAILVAVSKNTIETIQNDRSAFNKELTERSAEVLNGYGVEIHQTQLTEFAPCTAIAINGNAAVGNYQLWNGF